MYYRLKTLPLGNVYELKFYLFMPLNTVHLFLLEIKVIWNDVLWNAARNFIEYAQS